MKPVKRRRIVVGIDGGLPSRVAASILRNQDFDLLAVHLRIDLAAAGEDPALYPSSMRPVDLPSIEKFCESLGAPLKTIDVTGEVLSRVFSPFWIATLGGRRFSGSLAFAREILFPHLEAIALARGAEAIATGHFAVKSPELGRYPDPMFDQGRTLAGLSATSLSKLILPIGDVSLEMMMRLAKEIGAIPKGEKNAPFEQDLAILTAARAERGVWEWTDTQLSNPQVQARAAGDYFLRGALSGGDEFAEGEHRGVPFYQIGARSPQYAGYLVREIHPQSRTLIVGPPARLRTERIFVKRLQWIDESGAGERFRPRRVTAEKEPSSVRVPALGPMAVPALLFEFPDGLAEIRLFEPLSAIGTGDTLVLYQESRILGSAVVATVGPEPKVEKAIENPVTPA
jgi:tRNA-specific 2-thiouridylase